MSGISDNGVGAWNDYSGNYISWFVDSKNTHLFWGIDLLQPVKNTLLMRDWMSQRTVKMICSLFPFSWLVLIWPWLAVWCLSSGLYEMSGWFHSRSDQSTAYITKMINCTIVGSFERETKNWADIENVLRGSLAQNWDKLLGSLHCCSPCCASHAGGKERT